MELARVGLAAVCLALIVSALAPALVCAESEEPLPPISQEKIREELESVRKNLQTKAAKEKERSERVSKLLDEVRAFDERLLASARKREELEIEERNLTREVDQRQRRLREVERAYESARTRLQKRLSSLYKRGRLGSTRVLAHAASSTEPLRMARYLAAISRADSAVLEEYERARYEHERAIEALGEKKREIAAKQAALREEAERYEVARQEKATLLANLERELAADKTSVETLRAAEQELEQLLASIPPPPPIVEEEREAEEAPEVVASVAAAPMEESSDTPLERLFRAERRGAPLKDRKGDLEVPVRGELVVRFGERREAGPRVQGLVVRAPRDRNVVAVAKGEVVFAGPFPSLGNTVIINHGGRYHTVYAHLESILTEVGARVREAQVIGMLPRSQPTLHFELRAEGKALDPLDWFRGGLAAFRP